MEPVQTPAPLRERRHYAAGEIPGGGDHEELLVARGRLSGVTMAIAVHSTVLGQALGGLRMWHYASDDEAIDDALRLSAAMTRKAAVAGLDLGGGKAVIALPSPTPPTGAQRREILLDIGELVESLDGRYATAEDVGTTPADMEVIAERTAHVTGIAGSGHIGDPSPYTAIGVEAAMRAACQRRIGNADPAGLRIAIVGAGHVGEYLARSLAGKGARLTLSDVDPGRRALAEELGADWLEPNEAIIAECDVLAPCAVGGAINAGNVEALACKVICGAANNQLADPALAARLAARCILHTPDYVANAGGLISIHGELHGYDAEHATKLSLAIEEAVDAVFELAEVAGTTPMDAAEALARRKLAAA